MKAKKTRPFTERDARTFKDLLAVWDGLKGAAARDYLSRYIQLKEQSIRLKKMGLKVRIALPDFPRRPLLIIEK